MTREDQAKAFANSLEPIKDLPCPRDVINPGLWFGFMKGWEACEKTMTEEEMEELFGPLKGPMHEFLDKLRRKGMKNE